MSNLRESKERYAESLNKSEEISAFQKIALADDKTTLLKNSQVLELTTSTLPREQTSDVSNSSAASHQQLKSVDNQGSWKSLDKARTWSTGCLSTDRSSSLPSHYIPLSALNSKYM